MVKSAKEVTSTPHDLLTVSEVATILRVDDTTVRRWAKTGALDVVVLPHVNERQAYRVHRTTIDKMLSTPAVPSAK
jgi:excisionase family DNA binding protein